MRALAVQSIIGLLLSVTATLAWARQKPQKTTTERSQSSEASSQSSPPRNFRVATDSATYVIGPTDVLEVSVWKEPDVSRSVTVRPDGKISLPLINDTQAAGLTPMEVGSHIAKALEKFITAPQVTVTVNSTNSQRAYVVGEVTRPGEVNLLPNTTVLDALASAGGPTQFANGKKIFILRTEGEKQVRYYFNYQAAIKGDLRQNIVLKPGDTIVVP